MRRRSLRLPRLTRRAGDWHTSRSAPLAAAEAGSDVEAVQAALASWFLPVLVTGAVTFAFGVFVFAKGIADSRILSRRLSRLVVGALVVMAVARLVSVGAVQFYVQGVA